MGLTEQVAELARLRQERETLLAELETAEAKLNTAPEMAAVREAQAKLNEKNAEVTGAENTVRLFALGAWEESGYKKPAPGVSVRVFTKIKYDAGQAMQWCRANAPIMIKETLDKANFEKVAPSLSGAPVTIEQEPRIYIDSDLSGYLAPEPATGEPVPTV